MKVLAIFAAIAAVAVARPTTTSIWTLPMLDEALMNPNINPEVVPILADALNTIMTAIYTGVGNQLSVDVDLPNDVPLFLDHVESEPVVPAPVVPSPEETPAVSSSLVQIIINVNGKPHVAEVPMPVIPRPDPEEVEEEISGDELAVDRPEAVEESVEAIETEPIIIENNPVDIIAVNPIESGVQSVEDVGPM